MTKQSISFDKSWSKKDKKIFKSIQKKMFLDLNKDLKNKSKSRLFANILAGLIVSSKKMNKKQKFLEVKICPQ